MNIGIYSELLEGNALGGREFIVAVVCDELAARGHTVEFSHHQPNLSPQVFAAQFGIAPERVRLRMIETRPPASLRKFRASRIAQEHWDRELSGPYDLFLNIVHANPVECHAAARCPDGAVPVLRAVQAVARRSTARRRISAPPPHEASLPPRRLASVHEQLPAENVDFRILSTLGEISVEDGFTVIYPPTDAHFLAQKKRIQF
jgi:hypothetical protein